METTYTVKGKNSDVFWEFKYDLNGDLKQFKLLEGTLSTKQAKWLFGSDNFPFIESVMRSVWMPELKQNFEIIKGSPDLSFDSFWKLYNQKVKKVMAEKAWKRLSKTDRLEAIKGIKAYDGYLKRKGIAKAHPSTYLNQRYWEDNYRSIH